MGENRGELNRHSFDKWTFEGNSGDVISIEMVADQPVEDSALPLSNRFEGGLLDTMIFLIGPDGKLLGRANDGQFENGVFGSDAKLEVVSLPLDGTYEIQARSYLDDGAGGYTLHIDPVNITVDPQILETYSGHYVEGPWEYDVIAYVKDGLLLLDTIQTAETFELTPLSDAEFVDESGSRYVFIQDSEGITIRYDLWVSPIYPPGGQWYEAPKKVEGEE